MTFIPSFFSSVFAPGFDSAWNWSFWFVDFSPVYFSLIYFFLVSWILQAGTLLKKKNDASVSYRFIYYCNLLKKAVLKKISSIRKINPFPILCISEATRNSCVVTTVPLQLQYRSCAFTIHFFYKLTLKNLILQKEPSPFCLFWVNPF